MKLSRRGWWKSVSAAGIGVAVASKAEAKTVIPDMPPKKHIAELDVDHYRGFIIRWSGWKERQDSDVMAGQWTARPDGSGLVESTYGWASGVYSSFPGGVGYFNDGDRFDLTANENQKILSPKMSRWLNNGETISAEVFYEAKTMALMSIREFIRDNCDNGPAGPMGRTDSGGFKLIR